MSIGPFSSYAPPGVYTQTNLDQSGASGAAGLRIPVLIGVGSEQYTRLNLEMVRGSSASVDTLSTNEDMTGRFVDINGNLVATDGTMTHIKVRNFPIVVGDGRGATTNKPSDVTVKINNNPVAVAQVRGATGDIFLNQIPLVGDVVQVTYYYHRGDTRINGENLTVQADGIRTAFRTFNSPIVDGSGGGIATTDVTKVSITVNGVSVVPITLDGINGVITLATAPAAGTQVLVSYWTNTYQNTFDPLPNVGVSSIISLGNNPGKSDYVEFVDFVNEGDRINWGTSYLLRSDIHTPTTNYFGSSQVVATLIDNYRWNELAVAADASNKLFNISYTPVDGSGLQKKTRNPSKVVVKVNGAVVPVAFVDPDAKQITLSAAAPAGATVEVSYWYNIVRDESYTLKVAVPGASGLGTYTMQTLASGAPALALVDPVATKVANVNFTVSKMFPNAISDLTTIPGYSITEILTITFVDAQNYNVTSNVPNGSAGAGKVSRTYIDARTGVRFTIYPDASTSITFAAGDVIVINVNSNPNFVSSPSPILVVPGIRLTVTNTFQVGAGDTSILTTYDKAGNDPAIGAYYYVSYKWDKVDYTPKVFTKMKNIEAEYGTVSINNRASLGAFLAFLNGASAIGIKQVQREVGKSDANSVSYINGITELEKKIQNVFNADVIVPLTTDGGVQAYARNHVEKMSSIRYQGERVAVFGFPLGTVPTKAQTLAQGLSSNRVVMLYPDGAIIGIADQLGIENEYVVDGSMLAAALAGKMVSPQYDVATDMTHKELVGFKRLTRVLDQVEANQTAVAGITILEDLQPTIRIRQWFTTDMSSVLTRSPYVATTIDKVQQDARASLQKFIGKKNLPGLTSSMGDSLKNTLGSLVSQQILSEFKAVEVVVDPQDPTIILGTAFYRPVFSIAWIKLTLNVSA